MRKPIRRLITALTALSVLLEGCAREGTPSQGGLVEVRFRASSLTKAPSGTEPLGTLDVLLFREGSGKLEAAGSSSSGSVVLSVSPGETYRWYTVGNTPVDLSGIASESELTARRFSLGSCPPGAMPMTASGEVILEEGSSVSAVLSRSFCRVTLGTVSAPFLSEGYAISDARIERVFLMDAPVEGALLPDGTAAGKRANEGGLDSGLPASLRGYLLAERGTLLGAAPLDDGTVLQCCPDPEGKTRLVVEASLDGESSYYAVSLPPLEPNRSYELSRLVLLGPGSPSPDTPPGRDPVSFSIKIVPWTETDSPVALQ